jgi:septum formation protein
MLAMLSGNSHEVLTAVHLIERSTQAQHHVLVRTQVSFCKLDPLSIERYVQSGEPLDKAGAYAIQGRAAAFVRAIDGSYTNVVGLPLTETLHLLQQAGAIDALLLEESPHDS